MEDTRNRQQKLIKILLKQTIAFGFMGSREDLEIVENLQDEDALKETTVVD